MINLETDICPGCCAVLPHSKGPTHRYIGASPACWEMFSALLNGGQPPLQPAAFNTLLIDAYAVQHPGRASDQAIQSVAVHLLTLYSVLERGVAPETAIRIRQKAAGEGRRAKQNRFEWLSPPSFAESPTIADIVKEPTPAARTGYAQHYVETIWSIWWQTYPERVEAWYQKYLAQS